MIARVARVDARLVPFRWAWAEENAAAIAAHWERRRAERPALFNGRVLMVCGQEQAGDVLHASFFETDYANLLAWLGSDAPDRSVANGFAMGALRGRDGAFLLGEMAPHTANAGRVYFPCGTTDLSDVTPDGEVDLRRSLLREITEETGLTDAHGTVEPGWTIVAAGGLLAFIQDVRLHATAAEAAVLVEAHLRAEARPELSGIRILRGPGEIDEAAMPPVLPIFLRDAFARDQR